MQTQNTAIQRAPAAEELDQQAMAAIRDLLHGEENTAAAPRATARAPLARPKRPARPVPEQPEVAREEVAAPLDPQPAQAGSGLMDRVKGYRPKPKHIMLASLAVLILLRPWLVLGLLFLSAFLITGVFLILGHDLFWKRVLASAQWYAQRRPERAAELHRKLDGFAMRWDAILDRFPEGTVDGLYLPDFGDLATAEARHDDALDRRFATMRENEA